MKRSIRVWCIALLLLSGGVAVAERNGTGEVDAFLLRHQATDAAQNLSSSEKRAIGDVLRSPRRTLPDNVLAGLLKNPVAWRPGAQGRDLMRSIVLSLPAVATIPGAEHALKEASHPNASNFRGFGFEAIATAALIRYREPNGVNPKMERMSAEVKGANGRVLESDGCAVFGADKQRRLVTMKSVSSEKALRGAVHKAMSQLSLRNGSKKATQSLGQPGVLMLGYSDSAVLQKAQRKDWQAAANRSGGKLLVLAVDQRTGNVTRLASKIPEAKSAACRPLLKRSRPRRLSQLKSTSRPSFRSRSRRR